MVSKYAHVRYDRLPEHMRDDAQEYVEHGLEPGGFMLAVLTNDLVGAFGKADEINSERMSDWAMWLWNDAPHACWGSKEKVGRWIEKREENE